MNFIWFAIDEINIASVLPTTRNFVVGALPSKYVVEVKGIILTLSLNNKYVKLNQELVKYHRASQEKKTRHHLECVEIGDKIFMSP